MVQYLLSNHEEDIEDLEGDKSLLLILPTPLAVKVLKHHCTGKFSLRHVPEYTMKGIPSKKVGMD